MDQVSPEQERINRQMIELGRAMRGEDEGEAMRIVFNLVADGLGNLARCATTLERIQQLLETKQEVR